eukprot:TRINITY_DN61290_c0_g1_i1.p1 TRINITY_DN61290_c0_g1~~TRINITY_DN61290_c0_g1_i1.p1  ORF type:complete len:534 (-),score=40.21 TRINITY_DN61290_c0_g1_i1:298-1899(-)
MPYSGLTNLQRQKEYNDIANEYFKRGVSCEEQGQTTQAIDCYTRGVSVLTECLKINYAPSEVEAASTLVARHNTQIQEFAEHLKGLHAQPQSCTVQRGGYGNTNNNTVGVTSNGANNSNTVSRDAASGFGYQFFPGWFGGKKKDTKPKSSSATVTATKSLKKDPPSPQPVVGVTCTNRAATVIKPKPAKHPKKLTAKILQPPSTDATSNWQDSSSSSSFGSKNKDNTPATTVAALKKKGIESKMLDQILSSVVSPENLKMTWDDVIGLESAKQALYEAAILPLLRPDLFTGLRTPSRGILMFGPPGTGKTYLAKALASTARTTFFNISASTLTSKYVGDSEKQVKALFEAASALQPAVVFVDEIDSLLTERGDKEGEGSRRLKTEFMIQMEGLGSGDSSVVVIGATNRPYELDDAILRRFPKRIYIPLPEYSSRVALLKHLMKDEPHLSTSDFQHIARLTEGYSNSDMANLCKEACMQPIRELGMRAAEIPANKIRKVNRHDLTTAMQSVRPSASQDALAELERWSAKYSSSV